mmetsp:Transcript_82701/g.261206  ORF Transcript_82701/g.261206 Transcript_82701/m.261206 type:complete len:148 (+) Transcript_82701:91-534(+)
MILRCSSALLAAALVTGVSAWEASIKPCDGGELASCQCLLGCSTLGASPSQCQADGDMHKLVMEVIGDALTKHGSAAECDGMKCVVRCASQLGCLSSPIRENCIKATWNHESCHINCNGSHGIRGPAGASVLVAALVAGLLAGPNGR